MSDELKPCPFCGDTEEVGTRYDDKAWRVHCGACGGCAYGWETEGQAIATWNARAPSSNEALLREARETIEILSDRLGWDESELLAKIDAVLNTVDEPGE